MSVELSAHMRKRGGAALPEAATQRRVRHAARVLRPSGSPTPHLLPRPRVWPVHTPRWAPCRGRAAPQKSWGQRVKRARKVFSAAATAAASRPRSVPLTSSQHPGTPAPHRRPPSPPRAAPGGGGRFQITLCCCALRLAPTAPGRAGALTWVPHHVSVIHGVCRRRQRAPARRRAGAHGTAATTSCWATAPLLQTGLLAPPLARCASPGL